MLTPNCIFYRDRWEIGEEPYSLENPEGNFNLSLGFNASLYLPLNYEVNLNWDVHQWVEHHTTFEYLIYFGENKKAFSKFERSHYDLTGLQLYEDRNKPGFVSYYAEPWKVIGISKEEYREWMDTSEEIDDSHLGWCHSIGVVDCGIFKPFS